jgi:hypothetical protein
MTVRWISCVALIAACASTPGVAPSAIPDAIKAPAGESFALEAAATGVQIYECTSGKEAPGLYAWTFKWPRADLFDRAGRKIAIHYAGPTWEADDGSKVVGAVAARDDGPDRSAIPWFAAARQDHDRHGHLRLSHQHLARSYRRWHRA